MNVRAVKVVIVKLDFDADIVQKICNASNEYAEWQKNDRSTMYRY